MSWVNVFPPRLSMHVCATAAFFFFGILFNPSSKAERNPHPPALSWWLRRIWPAALNWNGFSSLLSYLTETHTRVPAWAHLWCGKNANKERHSRTGDTLPFLRNGDLLLSMYWLGTRLKFDMGFSFMLLKEQCSAIFWMTSSLRLRPRKSDSLLIAAGRSWERTRDENVFSVSQVLF